MNHGPGFALWIPIVYTPCCASAVLFCHRSWQLAPDAHLFDRRDPPRESAGRVTLKPWPPRIPTAISPAIGKSTNTNFSPAADRSNQRSTFCFVRSQAERCVVSLLVQKESGVSVAKLFRFSRSMSMLICDHHLIFSCPHWCLVKLIGGGCYNNPRDLEETRQIFLLTPKNLIVVYGTRYPSCPAVARGPVVSKHVLAVHFGCRARSYFPVIHKWKLRHQCWVVFPLLGSHMEMPSQCDLKGLLLRLRCYQLCVLKLLVCWSLDLGPVFLRRCL